MPQEFVVCFVLTFSKSSLICTFKKHYLKYLVINNLICLSSIYVMLIPKGILSANSLLFFISMTYEIVCPFPMSWTFFFPSMLFVPSWRKGHMHFYSYEAHGGSIRGPRTATGCPSCDTYRSAFPCNSHKEFSLHSSPM